MLGNGSINSAIRRSALPTATKALLEDMQGRLRIRLALPESDLAMRLHSGVLQGGGTGPWVFRQAFDHSVQDWTRSGDGEEKGCHL